MVLVMSEKVFPSIVEELRISDPLLFGAVESNIKELAAREADRSKTIDTKAGFLLAAVGIVSSLSASATRSGRWTWLPILAFAAAALAALWALRVRYYYSQSYGDLLAAAAIEQEEEDSANALLRYKRRVLAGTWDTCMQNAQIDRARANFVFAGQALFGTGILLVLAVAARG